MSNKGTWGPRNAPLFDSHSMSISVGATSGGVASMASRGSIASQTGTVLASYMSPGPSSMYSVAYDVLGHKPNILVTKKTYTLELNFEKGIMCRSGFSKLSSKSTYREFVMANFEKMEKGTEEQDNLLKCEIRTSSMGRASKNEKPYYSKQLFYFKTPQERDEFSSLIRAFNRCGKAALEAFKKLDVDTDGLIQLKDASSVLHKSVISGPKENQLDFSRFLLLYYQTVTLAQSENVSEESKLPLTMGLAGTTRGIAKSVMFKTTTGQVIESTQEDAEVKLPVMDLVLMKEEKIEMKKEGVYCKTTLLHTAGDLYLTNYRISFIPYAQDDASCSNVEIPLHVIVYLEPFSEKVAKVSLYTKDFRYISFNFGELSLWMSSFYQAVVRLAFPNDQTKCFAFVSKVENYLSTPTVNGWSYRDLLKEYDRLDMVSDPVIRIYAQPDYHLCETYPQYIAVPSNISDEELRLVAGFRSRSRLPVIAWKHPRTKAALCRCSQPLAG
jgi:hypothetical protein